MNDINDVEIIAALRRQMTAAAAKQVIAASNLANVDTPGYRAQEVDFDRMLDARLAGAASPRQTDPRHLSGSDAASTPGRDAAGLPARRDGNTVQLDRELLAMSRAGGEFAAAQTALSAKFRLVRYAINESR
jgi:flagellar basal-body rod protein FlgB